MIENYGGVTFFGLRKDFDAVVAGGIGVRVHAGNEVWIEPDLGRCEVSGVEREVVTFAEPDDLMPR